MTCTYSVASGELEALHVHTNTIRMLGGDSSRPVYGSRRQAHLFYAWRSEGQEDVVIVGREVQACWKETNASLPTRGAFQVQLQHLSGWLPCRKFASP